MSDLKSTAEAFFEACETGMGAEGCAPFMHGGATFSAQSEPIAEIATLADYCDWMKGLLTILEDGRYEIKAFAIDEARGHAVVYGVFTGTHTGDGGPVPATNKTTASDYVYDIVFTEGKISHMTKIWNAPWALNELGWA